LVSNFFDSRCILLAVLGV